MEGEGGGRGGSYDSYIFCHKASLYFLPFFATRPFGNEFCKNIRRYHHHFFQEQT